MKRKFAIIGDGFLASKVIEAYINEKMPDYELTCILGNNDEKLDKLSASCDCSGVKTLNELLNTEPEIVAELASCEAVKEYCIDILKSGASLMPLSIGAFADPDFYGKAKKTAAENDVKIYFPSGAIGGFDAMRSINLTEGVRAELRQTKCVRAYKDTPIYKPEIETAGVDGTLFEGTAAEAIELLPKMINIGVATSLATVGPENTYVKITGSTDMPVEDNSVQIRVYSDDIDMEFKVYSKNETLTSCSVVSFLNNLASPVHFY